MLRNLKVLYKQTDKKLRYFHCWMPEAGLIEKYMQIL